MPDLKLNEGVWTRQVLKGKKKERVTFIPDKTTEPVQTTIAKITADSKSAWGNLLGGDPNLDINTGIIIVRFNPDGKSGTAIFLSQLTSQPEIVHAFQQSTPTPGMLGDPGDFVSCLNGKQTILGPNFNFPLAFTECLPNLFI